jgi:hypothetical protein
MAQPHERESADPDATPPSGQPAGGDEEEPTERLPDRWTGSAPVPASTPARKRRRGVPGETTANLHTLDDEPWPPPPPPRPPNAPVTAPYPPPRPPAWNPPPRARGRRGSVGTPRPAGDRPRRRRWPWVLATLAVLLAACCACCVSWFWPYASQHPASVALPPQAAGLVRLNDRASLDATRQLEVRVRAQHWLAEDVFAAVYAEPRTGQRPVTIFGTTLFLLDPKGSLKAGFDGLTDELHLTHVRDVPAGPAGGYQRCAAGRRPGRDGGEEAVAVCGWADHGSIAIGVFSGRTVEQSAGLLRQLREQLVTRE